MVHQSITSPRHTLLHRAGLQRNKPSITRECGGRAMKSHALMYILKGEGSFEDEKTPRRRVRPGTFFYLYPNRWHNFDPDPGRCWTEYWVVFDGHEAQRRFGTLFPEKGVIFEHGVDARWVEAYERLYELWFFQPDASRFYIDLLLHQILADCYAAAHKLDFTVPADIWDRAKKALRRKLKEKSFDFEAFAKAEGLSYGGFRKSFRHRLGMAPKQYFLMLKIDRAKELLARPGRSVKETAYELGFEDPYYFSRIFKKKVGVSPDLYRKNGEFEKWITQPN